VQTVQHTQRARAVLQKKAAAALPPNFQGFPEPWNCPRFQGRCRAIDGLFDQTIAGAGVGLVKHVDSTARTGSAELPRLRCRQLLNCRCQAPRCSSLSAPPPPRGIAAPPFPPFLPSGPAHHHARRRPRAAPWAIWLRVQLPGSAPTAVSCSFSLFKFDPQPQPHICARHRLPPATKQLPLVERHARLNTTAFRIRTVTLILGRPFDEQQQQQQRPASGRG